MTSSDLERPVLGEFSTAEDESPTAGTLRVNDGRVVLDLLGCLEPDRLAEGSDGFAMNTRSVPSEGAHAVVSGLLRDGDAITLCGVSGRASTPLKMNNGVYWQRTDDRHSGDLVTMGAQFAVLHTIEFEEPAFDRIEIQIPALEQLLGRRADWRPFAVQSELGGYVPIVVVPIDDFEFEWREYALGLRHHSYGSPKEPHGEYSATVLSIRRTDGPTRFSDVRGVLADIRLLAEFASGAHAGAADITGIREGERFPSLFPIYSGLRSDGDCLVGRQPYLSLLNLVDFEKGNTVESLASDVASLDPERERLITGWLGWLASDQANRKAVEAFLGPLHEAKAPRRLEFFRSTVGVLEQLSDPDSNTQRVTTIPTSEVEQRTAAIQAVVSCVEESHAGDLVQWVKDVLSNAKASKGLGRKLGELIEANEAQLRRVLRSTAAHSHDDDSNLESPKRTARAIADLRGTVSHGTQSDHPDLLWRTDQVALIFYGVVLAELGFTADKIERWAHSKSHDERWWDRQR